MEKIDNFLNGIYGDSQSMMYFYIVLGAIALFFIILIIVTLATSKKNNKKEAVVSDEVQDAPKEETVEKEDNLSETQMFNKILMEDKQEYANDLDLKPEVKEEKVEVPVVEVPAEPEEVVVPVTTPEPAPVETPVVPEPVIEEPVKEEIPEVKEEEPVLNEVVTDNPLVEKEKPLDFYVEKAEPSVETEPAIEPEPVEQVEEPQSEELNSFEKSIIDLIKEEPEENKESDFNDYTIEMPMVKPIDVDDYLSRREQEEKAELEKEEVKEEIKEEVKEEPKEKTVFSDDELKDRLAKLKAKKQEKKEDKEDLADLMKAVGLEDTMVIPKINDEEKVILGK